MKKDAVLNSDVINASLAGGLSSLRESEAEFIVANISLSAGHCGSFLCVQLCMSCIMKPPVRQTKNIILMSYFRLTTYMLIRMVLNTAYRMIYPFLSIFARGLGWRSVLSLVWLPTAQLSRVEPFIFPFIETRGRKFGMLLGLGLFVLSMTLVALWPSLFTFGIALVFSLVGKAIFDPSLTSYVADHISYEKRGTAIGFLEFAWSLAFIVGIPAAGLLIASTWSAPFGVLGVLGCIAFIFILVTLTDSAKPFIISTLLGTLSRLHNTSCFDASQSGFGIRGK